MRTSHHSYVLTVSHAIACEWLAATNCVVFYKLIIDPWAELFDEKITLFYRY